MTPSGAGGALPASGGTPPLPLLRRVHAIHFPVGQALPTLHTVRAEYYWRDARPTP